MRADLTGALAALADPTRRSLVERLARSPRAVGALTHGLPVSRPAVSHHLKVLKAAGLVTDQADGARRVYAIDPTGLSAIRAWLDQFERPVELERGEVREVERERFEIPVGVERELV